MTTTIPPTPKSIDAIFKARGDRTSRGVVQIREYSLEERRKRAIKITLILWGIGLCFIIVPFAHFIIPPLLLISAPLIGRKVYQRASTIEGGQAPCPACGKPLPVAKGPDKWPLEDLCSLCQTRVEIEKIN